MTVATGIDPSFRLRVLRRGIARLGVGTREGLLELYSDVDIPEEELCGIVNGQSGSPSEIHLVMMEKVLDKLDDQSDSWNANSHPVRPACNPMYDVTRSNLEGQLIFDDYAPFARFAGIDLHRFCQFYGGNYDFDKVEHIHRQITSNLAVYLSRKKAGVMFDVVHSNGHTQTEDASIANTVLLVGGYQRSPRELAVFGRMKALGVATPRSPQRSYFLKNSGISQPTFYKFLKGDGATWPSTLGKMEAALDQVAREFPVAVVVATPIDLPSPQPEREQPPIEEGNSAVVGEIEPISAPVASHDRGELAQDVLGQVAQLLELSLEDEHFRSLFSANLSALSQLSRGQIELVETKAIARSGQIRWRVTVGDADLAFTT